MNDDKPDVRVAQNKKELDLLISFLNTMAVKTYAEIGSRDGGSFLEIVSNVPTIELAVAVDLPGGDKPWGGQHSFVKLNEVVQHLSKRGINAHTIYANSQDPTTLARMLRISPHYDFIFVDGDHRYEPCLNDYHTFSPYTSALAFHDIVGEGQTSANRERFPVEVPAVWQHVKQKHSNLEFIAPRSKMGIGVILLKENT